MKKLNFKNIKGMLSRDEMKQIKGGTGDLCNARCTADSNCDTICPFCNLDYPGAGYKTCGKS